MHDGYRNWVSMLLCVEGAALLCFCVRAGFGGDLRHGTKGWLIFLCVGCFLTRRQERKGEREREGVTYLVEMTCSTCALGK